jgi:hypothetical protein
MGAKELKLEAHYSSLSSAEMRTGGFIPPLLHASPLLVINELNAGTT